MGFHKEKRAGLAAGGRSEAFRTSTYGSTSPFRGVVRFVSTGASKQFRLGKPPRPGSVVELFCAKATTTNTAFVYLPTGYSFQMTSNSTAATNRKMVFNAGNQGARLVALSTSKVGFLKSTGVTVTTT